MRYVTAAFLILLLGTGCSSAPDYAHEEPGAWLKRQAEQERAPGVAVQFCTWESVLDSVTVDRSSIGGLGQRRIGKAPSGQWIFRGHLGMIDKFTAAIVYPIDPSGRQSHVFLSNRGLYSESSWSKWVGPDFISRDPEVMFKVLSGTRIEADSEARPRLLARFKTESFLEYLHQSKEQHAASLDSCPLKTQ